MWGSVLIGLSPTITPKHPPAAVEFQPIGTRNNIIPLPSPVGGRGPDVPLANKKNNINDR